MFFGSSSVDLKIVLFLLAISLVVSLIVLAAAKRKFLALIIFSVLGNAIFLLAAFLGSEIFRAYQIIWLEIFSLLLWPVLNIFLLIYYFKTKPGK